MCYVYDMDIVLYIGNTYLAIYVMYMRCTYVYVATNTIGRHVVDIIYIIWRKFGGRFIVRGISYRQNGTRAPNYR